MIPWLLRHTVSEEVYRTREIERVLNIPSSLLIAAVLIVLAYVGRQSASQRRRGAVRSDQSAAREWRRCSSAPSRSRCGAKRCRSCSACSRLRTACSSPALRSCPILPVIAELAAAVDVPVITLVVGLLTRRIHKRLGTTSVGRLAALREH